MQPTTGSLCSNISLVLRKFIIFTILMIVVPMAAFYLMDYYSGNLTWAGIVSAISANLVLISFIIMAFSEE
jgi:vacuolar ATPase assembly integral membrane protein VMA21